LALLLIDYAMTNTTFSRTLNWSVFMIASFLLFAGCSSGAPQDYAIIEIVASAEVISEENMIQFGEAQKIEKGSIYNWADHWVLYIDKGRTEEIESRLKERFPQQRIKVYKTPFYHFNREKDCDGKAVTEQKHIIMTANLVDNEAMQHDYMEYHRSQREEWPEVEQGFCDADFQHVMVYRTDRQLMLVIIIPAGERLEELNPKTVEHNPRAEEWNSIMANFQEGLEDAPEGVTWIEFAQI